MGQAIERQKGERDVEEERGFRERVREKGRRRTRNPFVRAT